MQSFRTGLLLVVGLAFIPLPARAGDPSTKSEHPQGNAPTQVTQTASVGLDSIFGSCDLKNSSTAAKQNDGLPRWLNFGLGRGGKQLATSCSCGGTCGKISGCNCDYCDGCSSSDCTSCCSQGCAANCGTASFQRPQG